MACLSRRKIVLETKFISLLSFDYAFRCIFYLILKKLKVEHYFPNVYILNCFLLLASGSISLCNYLYWRKESIGIYIFIIILRISIKIVMDYINFFIFRYKGYHPSRLIPTRGIINITFFAIFSGILYLSSKNSDKWLFSFLSNMSLDSPGITIILIKILYLVSFGIQKVAFLLILFEENPIVASFSRLIYYVEPYITKIILKFFYDENIQIGPLEIQYEILSGFFILIALPTSIELIILPCHCLNKDVKYVIAENLRIQKPKIEEEEEEEKKNKENKDNSQESIKDDSEKELGFSGEEED